MWKELDIAATKDVKAIRKAYAVRLRVIDKADDRDAFQRLRAAYERALAQAERSAPLRPMTPPPPEPQQAPQPALHQAPEPPAAQPERTRPEPEPAAPKPKAPTPEQDALSALLAQIQKAVAARDIPAALTLYERGLALAIVPFDTQHAVLDHIMRAAVTDRALDSKVFAAAMARVGWDKSLFGQPVSAMRGPALARLEAENWYRGLADTARGPSLWQWLGIRLTQSPAAIWRMRAEQRNARLFLRDRPQLYRISKRTVTDLQGKLARYRQHEAWLKDWFAPACITRIEAMLGFDERWGNGMRKALFVACALPFVLLVIGLAIANIGFGIIIGLIAGNSLRRAYRRIWPA